MICNQSLSDWFQLEPLTQKIGATSLSVFLGQDQAKLSIMFKKCLFLRAIMWMTFETRLWEQDKRAELEFI